MMTDSYDPKAHTLFDKLSGLTRRDIDCETPHSREQLLAILLDANRTGTRVTVVSTGRNWGYGGTLPVENGNRLVSLQNLNRILGFDRNLGVLHLEAGVTQAQLEAYLRDHGFDYYLPNTGAGPMGSIIGNALERGFGISPIEDHAGSILSINGFLADGTPYTSPLNEVDPTLGSCFPHGIGIGLDRLAPQSSWLAVTDAKIQLVRRAEAQELFMVSFKESNWNQTIALLQELTQRFDLPLGGYKILHRAQIQQSTQTAAWIDRLTKQDEWTLLFFLRANRSLMRPMRSQVQNTVRKHGLHAKRWTAGRIEFLIGALRAFNSRSLKPLQQALTDLLEFFRLGAGHASDVGHKVVRPEQGLIWLSPLCPMTPQHTERLRNITQTWSHGTPLKASTWTWTVLNPRTLALVMPLTFPIETSQDDVWMDYRLKLEALLAEGFAPYRLPIECMDFARERIAPEYFKLAARVEEALDPGDRLNAGRYAARGSRT